MGIFNGYKKTRISLTKAGRFALAVFIKRPQAVAQISADSRLVNHRQKVNSGRSVESLLAAAKDLDPVAIPASRRSSVSNI